MDTAVLLEYAWVLIVLIGLEGLLAADNAVVLAVMVRHLDPVRRKKALFYGLLGAFVFRVIAILLLVWLVQWWWVQALGALYLFYVSISHLLALRKNKEEPSEELAEKQKEKKQSGFWMTVLKVELADIAFAVDSILAAAAIALALPAVGGDFFGVNAGQYTVMLIGGLIGVIIMRFFANYFVELLAKRPSLEVAAFVIVGWVGVKLSVLTLAHEAVGIIPAEFPHSTTWKIIFWAVMVIIVLVGWFAGSKKTEQTKEA
ncbi:Integral membrane protein TerC family protein [Jeotgalicoccus aerolatus]|jgi:YkoY family integral membrane protein|uniref:YkoY family integral membrane protein n=1 Tax=Jeotgalicoccus aerolatus TaxID=709510 RepID=A0ABS4HK58_9STAP|nr:TerC family protein [Jeotgalicoccus aerolatus]MBP1951300.1 YkoY family integral membrane protein [Jeotgalicoccus aerolatus]NMA80823.1 TerC family protein [Jeotgalicoccus aerolatus]CAD2077245.1 Integral membrane protein TerC family protein [Jeotgalicoccus aerolatus]GGD98568.1 membrane protein [Jeotgalicoccus aerolatus]HJG33446.1 TerC family protein [Jeotgalicoccus aerolatus]